MEINQLIYFTLLFTMFMYAVFFIAFIFNKYYKVYKSKYYLERAKFTNEVIEQTKVKIKSFEENKKNEMLNKMAKMYVGRNYNEDVQDDYIEILDSLRCLCEGVFSDYYDQELIRISIGRTIEEYLRNATKYNIISNTEEYIAIELLVKEWESKRIRSNNKRILK